ncbi:unnamed protein product [Spirodela intermedia]|uniref:Uncharacterized protein n=1 Tax=Spirodela intermedia TaxID=51605 RepID=A0A7I8L9J6_SPIIN|nr:unnamed protein product [Spirodela intermedia]
MAMPWRLVFHMAEVVWMVLQGWLSSCLMVADEIARALRSGDIGPFPVG